MTTTAKPSYGTPVTLTCTLASLASDTNLLIGRQSTAANNAADLADDCHVGGKFTLGTSPTVSKQVEIWCYSSYDGTSYSAGLGATDASFTTTSTKKGQMKLVTIIPTEATSNFQYTWGPYSVAALHGGTMPQSWGIFIVHNSGVAANSTAGSFEVKYTPIQYQSI